MSIYLFVVVLFSIYLLWWSLPCLSCYCYSAMIFNTNYPCLTNHAGDNDVTLLSRSADGGRNHNMMILDDDDRVDYRW